MAPVDSEVRLAIGSRVENIELVQIAVEASLTQLRVDEGVSHSVAAAVREAVANAIQHGNSSDPGKQVEIAFGLKDDEVVIRITDQGAGFDPGTVADPLAPENLLRPQGRGILFMKQFMDEIDYSFRPEGGTVVTLRKRIADPPRTANREEEPA